MIKRLIRRNMRVKTPRRIQIKKHELKSGDFKFINYYVHDPY